MAHSWQGPLFAPLFALQSPTYRQFFSDACCCDLWVFLSVTCLLLPYSPFFFYFSSLVSTSFLPFSLLMSFCSPFLYLLTLLCQAVSRGKWDVRGTPESLSPGGERLFIVIPVSGWVIPFQITSPSHTFTLVHLNVHVCTCSYTPMHTYSHSCIQ